jgi:hypothetical protein
MTDWRGMVFGAAVVGLAGAGLGYATSEATNGEHHESGVRCLSADGAISCELPDDWTVSVPLDVSWSGAGGSHEGSRPACLPPTGRGLEGPVELVWVPVEADGSEWREVVWVGC